MKRCLLLGLSVCMLLLTGLSGWGLTLDRSGVGSVTAEAQTRPPQKPSRPKTFTGIIVRDGELYVLRDSSGEIYKLDDSKRAQPFDGKAVNVTGGFDAETRLIHVYWIEPDWV